VLKRATPERISLFSDGVFAVLITILVLDLHPPAEPKYVDLLSHWQQWLSYFVSYVFIAIVWANHHYLIRYAKEATPRLIWFNFAHLLAMSLLPFSTEWMAISRLAPEPVSFYALVFFLVNVTYVALIWELVDASVSAATMNRMRRRSLITLCLFGIAALVSLAFPLAGLAICIGCLTVYLKPDPAGA
jgi:uncharacterized membrane protein